MYRARMPPFVREKIHSKDTAERNPKHSTLSYLIKLRIKPLILTQKQGSHSFIDKNTSIFP